MNFTQMRVGTQLTLRFAAILLLMAVVVFVGIAYLNNVVQTTREIKEVSLLKERLASEQFKNVSIGVRRLLAIAKSSDPSLGPYFQAEAQASTKRGNEIIEQLSRLPSSAEEVRITEEIAAARARYLQARDAITAAKAAGRNEQAGEILEQTFVPAATTYVDKVKAYMDYQVRTIDGQAAHVFDNSRQGSLILGSVGALALLVGVLAAWSMTRTLTRQIGGEPAYASSVAREIAAGNLQVQVRTRPGDTRSLMADISRMRDSLAAVVGRVRQGSEAIASASAQISHGNADLSSRTESQASALEQTAASMEQLGSTVKQNADNARQANLLAQNASAVAARGGEVVTEVVDTMKAINDSSRKIADIISVIDAIAFQTNILALNAAVEAARAGEQGRGFAVVAGEVRNLASRSADAAKEIKALIEASVQRVEQGSALVDKAGATMTEVVASIRRVTDIVGEISAASREQDAGVSQVGEAVSGMDQTTQQNAAMVEEIAAAAASLNTQAQELLKTVAVFQLAPSPPAGATQAAVVTRTAQAGARTATRDSAGTAARLAHKAPAALGPVPARMALAGGGDWESF
jgi:methyl-accepting chemotaxis protein